MMSRQPLGYVVKIEGVGVTLNLFDMHRGHLAAHGHGVSSVTEIGSLLAVESGARLLVLKVSSLSFAEPKEAHRFATASPANQSEPLRHITGVIVGQLRKSVDARVEFFSDSLSSPPLGAEVYPLLDKEMAAILGRKEDTVAPVHLGEDLRGGGELQIGLQNLISRHVAVLGSSGQGKSCFTAAILQQIARFPSSRTVIFDINGEYEDALRLGDLPPNAVQVTRLGGEGEDGFKLPYYALGRQGLQRLLLPSDKTQRPALTFALEHLNRVEWYEAEGGVGLADDSGAYLFDDCRLDGADDARERIERLQAGKVPYATKWPPMMALSTLVAESHAIAPAKKGYERNHFYYGNVAPLLTRISRFAGDPMFQQVVDVEGGNDSAAAMDWASASSALVDRIFGGERVDWRVHVVDLRLVSHDLMPFVLGAILELYAYELFERGQLNKVGTLLVLEEAHHYLRSVSAGEEGVAESLAYERLAKEGRKFGLALWLSTQRPSEISTTVLSQCNNWISFRLNSEKDLAAISAASEWADKGEVKRIAGLARQNAVAFGGSIQMPTLIRAPTAIPLPRSEEAAFDRWVSVEGYE